MNCYICGCNACCSSFHSLAEQEHLNLLRKRMNDFLKYVKCVAELLGKKMKTEYMIVKGSE